MGCLTVSRWCCCCFLATINVLTTILGLAFFVLGCLVIWGYWILRQVTDPMLKDIEQTMKASKVDINVDLNLIQKAIESLLVSTAIVLLVLGVLLIVISCLGCCGACFGVPSCLIIYSVIVGLLILAQATVVIIWFTDSNLLKRCARSTLENRVANYKGIFGMDGDTLQMDVIHMSLHCCGVDDGDDFYKLATNWNRTIVVKENGRNSTLKMVYPFTCCKISTTGLMKPECSYQNVSTFYSNYRTGCYSRVTEIIDEQLKLNNFFYSLAGSLAIDALLIIGALVIFFHKRQEQADIPHSSVQYKMTPQMA